MRRRQYLTTLGAATVASGCTTRPWEQSTAAQFSVQTPGPIAAFTTGPDQVYLGAASNSAPGELIALSPTTGEITWRRPTTAAGNTLRLAVRNGSILVWDSVALELSVLEDFVDTPWSRSAVASFPPPSENGTVFLQHNTTIEAATLTTGERRWEQSIHTPAGNALAPRPESLVDGTLITTLWNGRIAGLNPRTGDLVWWTATNNVGPRLVAIDDAIIVGGEFQTAPVQLHRLNPTTGAMTLLRTFEARHAHPLNIPGAPFLLHTIEASGDRALHRINPQTGDVQWTVPGLWGNLRTSADSHLLVGHHRRRNQLHAINPSTGDTLWETPAPQSETVVPTVTTPDAVYAQGTSTVHAYNRTTGTTTNRLDYDADTAGRYQLETTGEAAYLIAGDTLYGLRA